MIAQNIERIRKTIPQGVTLIAVSKFHGADEVMAAYNVGERNFGESRVQELDLKRTSLPEDIKWHFIGHLQTNKVKYIAPYVWLIHGIDSIKILKEVNRQAQKVNRVINCLLQLHIAQEETKYGFTEKMLIELLESKMFEDCKNINVVGVMGMATNTQNIEQITSEFAELKAIYQRVKKRYFGSNHSFNTLSMGMSDDYDIAIEQGSNMVRIGTAIFGDRNY